MQRAITWQFVTDTRNKCEAKKTGIRKEGLKKPRRYRRGFIVLYNKIIILSRTVNG
jgi:hypothetical protein